MGIGKSYASILQPLQRPSFLYLLAKPSVRELIYSIADTICKQKQCNSLTNMNPVFRFC